MSDVEVRPDIDVALDWIVRHVAHFDNIRHRNGEWQIQLWHERPDCNDSPHRFAAATFTDCVDQALAWVLAERSRLGVRGGDS